MNSEVKMFKKIKEIISLLVKPIIRISNLTVFITFIVTAFVMYRYVGNKIIGVMIMFAAFFFLLFNKIELMDKRLKLLEEK